MAIMVNPKFEQAALSFAKRARGQVYNHKSFQNGDEVTTSEVVEEGESWFRTENTRYVVVAIKEK